MILLSVAGSLPELAITISGAVAGNLGMAAGNLIGGVAGPGSGGAAGHRRGLRDRDERDAAMNGVIFGATFLAAATALPEISTGITGVRLGRYTLVFGDMFGGNAFQLTLFFVADLVAGQPVLPAEGKANAWIGCVGLLMTAVFVSGIVLRPQRRHLGLGLDSWVALVIYALGIWGLVVVSG
jgi:cation:H+ antiporter